MAVAAERPAHVAYCKSNIEARADAFATKLGDGHFLTGSQQCLVGGRSARTARENLDARSVRVGNDRGQVLRHRGRAEAAAAILGAPVAIDQGHTVEPAERAHPPHAAVEQRLAAGIRETCDQSSDRPETFAEAAF